MASKTSAHIGKAVSSRRFLKGWSVADLADRIGVTRQAVDYIERGSVTPRMQTLEKIAQALDCEVRDLIP